MAQRQEELTLLYELYEKAQSHSAYLRIRNAIPKCVDFYEGRQWPAPTESTKNLPRPVINVVKSICRSKKSAILSTPTRVSFKSYTQGVDVSKFNSFANSIFKELGQAHFDRLAIDDAVKKGSYFYHYYWDKNATDLNGIRDGGVRCELIDPLNIFFANPTLPSEQEQRWILIATQLEIDDALAMADKGLCLTRASLQNEAKENGYVTLLTQYFRINGEVFCQRATKTRVINAPFPLAPSSLDMENSQQRPVRAGLYPIVAGVYERKEGSIYGLSEIEGIIPNQKAINFNIAMSLLNAQECAWGKYIALPNALKGQKISNVPGQVLIDHTGTGEGIRRMNDSPLSQIPGELSSTLIDLTKSVTGASGIAGGELEWTNLSGTAIARLQAQAQVPLEDLRNEFWEAKRKQGLIIAQFMKLYYYKKPFITRIFENGREREVFDFFTSKDYENAIFDTVVEITGGGIASCASDISMLDTCLKNGSISIETYIKAYPESAISNKSELLKQIELEKASELCRLREEIKRLKGENSQINA